MPKLGGECAQKFGYGYIYTLGTGTQKVMHFGNAKSRVKPNDIAVCAQCYQTFQ